MITEGRVLHCPKETKIFPIKPPPMPKKEESLLPLDQEELYKRALIRSCYIIKEWENYYGESRTIEEILENLLKEE